MEEDVLSGIIGIEKEIGERVQSEKARSREWLEKVREETARELESVENGLEVSFKDELERARRDADERASEIVREAVARAEYLQGMSDGELRAIIMRHIGRILPGERHDRKDVKG